MSLLTFPRGGGGVLSIMAYTRRLYPTEGVAFSGVRFLKGQGVEIYKRVQGKSVFPSVKRPNNNKRIKESMKKSKKFLGFLTFS